MSKYDFVVVGSGLGGLECATILSKEGYSVCVLEKNGVVGGCLQSFRRNGHLMDTGIHYIGSLDEGEILNQYFRYFGILDRIKLRRLDEEAFDIIHYKGKGYRLAMGFDRFVDTLSEQFPHEHKGIAAYISRVKQVYGHIGVDHLRSGVLSTGGLDHFSSSASGLIEECVADPDLRNILAGNVTLYGGAYDYSTLYHHAMVTGSNISGSYRIVDGSQTAADAFVEVIRANGGVVKTGCEVTRFVVDNERVTAVEVNGEERVEADNFISNIHPMVTLNLLDRSSAIRKAYQTRISSLPNSYGLFTVYVVLKKKSYPYINSNIYYHDGTDAWYANRHPEDKSIRFALLCNQASSHDEAHADVVTILSPMHYDEVAPWDDTFTGLRDASYREFKERKAEQLIDFCCRFDPMLRQAIERVYTSSPLTYRDYTGTPNGSAYGIMKEYKNPMICLVPTRTKIGNLHFTGQNMNVHGALGVSLTATLTCSEFLGREYLTKKIGSY